MIPGDAPRARTYTPPMSSLTTNVGVALAMAGCAAFSALAQTAPAARNFEAEIRTSLQAAKTAAEFDFLGTLVRTCLLPQSGGEDTRDTLPDYVADPTKAPARDMWFAE